MPGANVCKVEREMSIRGESCPYEGHSSKVLPNSSYRKQNVETSALLKLFKQVGMSSLPSVSSGNATEACISGSPVYPYISIKKIGS